MAITPEVVDLVSRLKGGDNNAFGPLYNYYKPQLMGYLSHRYNFCDGTLADITQQAFMRAYHHIGQLREPKNFWQWLYKIADNVGMEEFRRVSRRNYAEPVDPTDLAEFVDLAYDPASALIASEDREALRQLLTKLREVDVEALSLNLGEGVLVKDIAKRQGRNVGTVKSGMHRAKLSLRGLLSRAYQS